MNEFLKSYSSKLFIAFLFSEILLIFIQGIGIDYLKHIFLNNYLLIFI